AGRRRPGRPGRARPAGRLPAGHRRRRPVEGGRAAAGQGGGRRRPPRRGRAAMLAVAEAFAPEHLELLVAAPGELAAQVRNAGAVFVGPWTPVALGDYAAGTNHVLPTAGTARFASGLSTLDFLRTMQIA